MQPKPGWNRIFLAAVGALLLAAVVLYFAGPGRGWLDRPAPEAAQKTADAPAITPAADPHEPEPKQAPVVNELPTPAPVVAPRTAMVVLGATRQFSANNVSRWRASAGLIDASGFYTAPTAMPRSGRDIVTAAGPGGSATATVTLRYPPPEIDPETADVVLGAARRFSASSVTGWKAISGRITSAGLYTAPATMPHSGKDTVTATGPGGSVTATVTLRYPPPEIDPETADVVLGAARRFSASNVTGWKAISGRITSAGLYTAPSRMTPSGTDTVTATGPGGSATATVTLKAPAPLPPPPTEAGNQWKNPKDGLIYVRMPAGSFMTGCSPGDSECSDREKPARRVTIAAFSIGQTPVTQEAYQQVTGTNPSYFRGAKLPVENVRWNEAQNYCKAVGMTLPTETQWEYAARAGTTGARYGPLDAIAWYDGNSNKTTHPVGQKLPNAWGLYDMLGNVVQWTASDYDTEHKALRGGSFDDSARSVRVSFRGRGQPDSRDLNFGFRCVGE